MLSWCSVRENKAHEVVLQDNDREQSSSGDNALHAQRAEGVYAALEHRQSARSTWKCVLRRQKIHDVRKTHIHEYSQPAETRGSVNDTVKASSQPWSTRHGPQSCILRCDRRKILTRASCEGCNVARRNRKHQGPSETQKNETIEEKFIRTDRETAHSRQGQRE